MNEFKVGDKIRMHSSDEWDEQVAYVSSIGDGYVNVKCGHANLTLFDDMVEVIVPAWKGKVTVDSNEYRVSWWHHHPEVPDEIFNYLALTKCWVISGDQYERGEDYEKMADGYGWAKCSPEDNFSRRVGRKLSLQRALLNSGFTRVQRKQVWDQVLSVRGLT